MWPLQIGILSNAATQPATLPTQDVTQSVSPVSAQRGPKIPARQPLSEAQNRSQSTTYTGAPASGSLSIAYLLFTIYIKGTPGTLLTRLRSSRSHVATM